MKQRLTFTVPTPVLLAVLALHCMPANVFGKDAIKATDGTSIATDYCRSFASQAAELRAKGQREELEKLRLAIEEKLHALKERTESLEGLIKKRNDMIELASGELLKIYSRMEAEPAAKQLEKIDVATAASVLRRLKPKLAGEILAAMEITRASQLVQVIAIQDSNISEDSKS